jgi:hypothetical protein
MAETKFYRESDDETTNDYISANNEIVEYHKIVSSFGTESLIIFKIIRDNEFKVLRYDGREIIKVIYTGPDGVSIQQAFYRSTGTHIRADLYSDLSHNINTERTWVPFDGIGYYDENSIVQAKRDYNKGPTRQDYLDFKNRTRSLYKCDYFGNELAYRFGEAVDPEFGLNKYYSNDKKINKNFDLARYGDLKTLRISYLLSSGDEIEPPFWVSPLGQRIIDELGFRLDDIEYDEFGKPESVIRITNDYVEAEHREVNNFIADFISYNWQNGSPYLPPNYFKDRRKKRDYDLRYSYMPTAKGTWVMFNIYLQTNPDSRLPMESQTIESKKTKEAYDILDSNYEGPFRKSFSEIFNRD